MKNIRFFLSENIPFLAVKFSTYLNRHVFVMIWKKKEITKTKENIYCKCRGLYASEMVQCVACEAWLHHRCIDKRIVKQIEEKKNFVFQCC